MRTFNVKFVLIFLLMAMLIWPAVMATEKKEESPRPTGSLEDLSRIREFVIAEWPKEDKFQSGFVHTDSVRHVEIFYPKGQSTYNWKEMGWVEYFKTGTQAVNLVKTARSKYLDARHGCPDATWDIIEKPSPKQKYQYIIFQITCPDYLADEPGDVQLWKIISGKTGVFVVQYSYRGEEMPKKKRKQILKVLGEAHIVTEPIKGKRK